MRNQKIQDLLIRESSYQEEMLHVVEPYLAGRERNYYLKSGVPEHPARRGLNRLLQGLPAAPLEEKRVFCVCYRADQPRGIVLISHGFCETAEKYKEAAYYFVRMGYHVFIPEHCGHGRSYRLTRDLSLVHVDRYERYVADLLHIAGAIHRGCPQLPLYLFGHSMGGGIAAATAAADHRLSRPSPHIRKLILNAPMIRPSTGNLPWRTARAIARVCCRYGKGKSYIPGHHPYQGPGVFEHSSSTCRPRYDYYQQKKLREPLFQTNAASCQWLYSAFRLYRHLIRRDWRQIGCPVALFQAEQDTLVSKEAQDKFVRRLNRRAGHVPALLIPIPGSRHEIFNSEDRVLADYWQRIFDFLEE